MLEVSREFTAAFDRRLEKAAIPEAERPDYRKWALYYLDFCHKYDHPPRATSSLGPFLAKLESKGQSAAQREQATRVVRLLLAAPNTVGKRSATKVSGDQGHVASGEAGRPTAPLARPVGGERVAEAQPANRAPRAAAVASGPALSGGTASARSGASWERE